MKKEKINIQNLFYVILKGRGLLEALAWLLETAPDHRFARRQAERFLPSQKTLRDAMFWASVRQFQADCYAQFRLLSERQKTLRGGFRGFLVEHLPEGTCPTEEADFVTAICRDSVRDNRGGSCSEYSWWGGRPNYRREADTAVKKLEGLQKQYVLCLDILKSK